MNKQQKQKQQKPQSLVGRQVYFKMSKQHCKDNVIKALTPGKLYTIQAVSAHGLPIIKADIGDIEAHILLGKNPHTKKPWCSYLRNEAVWILKRRAPSKVKQKPSLKEAEAAEKEAGAICQLCHEEEATMQAMHEEEETYMCLRCYSKLTETPSNG